MRTTVTKQEELYEVIAHDHYGKEGNLGIFLRFFESLVEERNDGSALTDRKGSVEIVLLFNAIQKWHEKKHRWIRSSKLNSFAFKHILHVLNRLLYRYTGHLSRERNNT